MSFVENTFNDLTGKTAADAAKEGATIQGAAIDRATGVTEAGIERGLGFLDPYSGVGQQGIDQAGFLTDPNAQFNFLQNNPLFKLALESANTETQNIAAAGGRLSAGDTLQKLTENTFLTAAPLISEQKRSITDLLNFGSGIAANQGNISAGGAANVADLITTGGAVEAGGTIGAANARTQATQGLLQAGLTAGAIFSDSRLKSNIQKTGSESGHNTYTWIWNKAANLLGLFGSGAGVLADEVFKVSPEAITTESGYMKVNYKMIGVNHGC